MPTIATGEPCSESVLPPTSNVTVWPVKSNAGFLTRALSHTLFRSGNVDTGLIGRELDTLAGDGEPTQQVLNAAADYAAFVSAWDGHEQEFSHSIKPTSPWQLAEGFRLNRASSKTVWLSIGTKTYTAERAEEPQPFTRYTKNGLVVSDRGETFVFGRPVASTGHSESSGAILSPMPGKIIAVEVTQGQSVTKGQKLLTLEAMKMEHSLTAPFDGVVAELNAVAGAQVQVEALLARIEAAE